MTRGYSAVLRHMLILSEVRLTMNLIRLVSTCNMTRSEVHSNYVGWVATKVLRQSKEIFKKIPSRHFQGIEESWSPFLGACHTIIR